METENRFKTKTGYCRILSDKLVLSYWGTLEGDQPFVRTRRKYVGRLAVYGLISFWALKNSLNDYYNQDWLPMTFSGLIGGILLLGIIQILRYSPTPVIERTSIRSLKFIPARKFISRAYFKVEFEHQGKMAKRLIMLPGSLSNGPSETENALKVMKKAGLI